MCSVKRVLYVQYTNPAGYPPLEHSSRILADAGWEILFLGIESWGAKGLEFPPHPDIRVLRWNFYPGGVHQKAHYLAFAVWVAWTVLRWRPDWIYASDPLSCPAVIFTRALTRVRVIYHEHDSPARSLESADGEGGRGAFQRFVLYCRQALAQRAELCVLPNQNRGERFGCATRTKRPVFCVWNCPRKEEAQQTPCKSDGEPFLYYHGNLGPELVPMTAIRALASVPSVRLKLIGYSTAGQEFYISELKSLARECRLADRLEFLPALPRAHLLVEARKSSVGLALMPRNSPNINLRHLVGASNKPFDYMACGLALLVSDLPDWKEMFVEPGYGRACDANDPESISDALNWFIHNPKETRLMGERGRQQILKCWNYETQFEEVKRRLEDPPF